MSETSISLDLQPQICPAPARPSSEVVKKATRRRFNAEFKKRILDVHRAVARVEVTGFQGYQFTVATARRQGRPYQWTKLRLAGLTNRLHSSADR